MSKMRRAPPLPTSDLSFATSHLLYLPTLSSVCHMHSCFFFLMFPYITLRIFYMFLMTALRPLFCSRQSSSCFISSQSQHPLLAHTPIALPRFNTSILYSLWQLKASSCFNYSHVFPHSLHLFFFSCCKCSHIDYHISAICHAYIISVHRLNSDASALIYFI